MSQSTILLGRHNGGQVYRANESNRDVGSIYNVRLTTNPDAPLGEGGLCIFTRVHLTMTHRIFPGQQAVIRVTPIVDEVRVTKAARVITITGDGQRHSIAEPIPLRYPYGLEQYGRTIGLFSPRGTRISLEIVTMGGVPEGELTLDGYELRWSAVGEERGSALVTT